MSHVNTGRSGLNFFRRIKPSYIVLLALLPLFIYLFIFNQSYQNALKFILPGIYMTVALTISSYILAFIIGLALAGGHYLKKGKRAVPIFTIISVLFLGAAALLYFLPKQDYVLIGEPEGTVAIIQDTPKHISSAVREGTYTDGAETRAFRAVPSAEAALERVANGTYTGALIPIEFLEDGTDTLWQTSVIPRSRMNLLVFFMGIGVLVGLLAFASSQSNEHPVAIFSELYIDIVRGIPMLVLIVFIGLVLPGELGKIGLLLEPPREYEFLRNLQRGTLAIGLVYAAYMAEIFRAGIEAVPKGQLEAAKSLGLSNWQAVRRVILPQAIKIVIPPLGNDFIAMFKDTALISVIGTQDIFRLAREIASRDFNSLPPFNTVAVLYIVLTLGASAVLRWLEKRADTSDR